MPIMGAWDKRRIRRTLGRVKRLPRRRAAWRRRDRLLVEPVFIICTLRSGSTLLRVLLDSHSRLHAPHEMHLRYISVHLDRKWSERSMKAMKLDAHGLEYLLWDRLLDRTLARSGKSTLVEKTPNNVFIADRVRECWPDARFLFLLRHPAAIARSRLRVLGEGAEPEANVDLIRRYCEALEAARQAHAGHTVRYEELTADPERVLRGVCSYLGVRFERRMVEYGRFRHGPFRPGLGDWKERIRTGTVQPAEPPPEVVPEPLLAITRAWGY